jgi:hypothetical protein
MSITHIKIQSAQIFCLVLFYDKNYVNNVELGFFLKKRDFDHKIVKCIRTILITFHYGGLFEYW